MRLIYIFDAYCIWSYAFSSVFQEIFKKFSDKVEVEILSGGMIIPNEPVHISILAPAFLEVNEVVENTLKNKVLGDDFLWHLQNPDLSDWYPNSITPAQALVAFKELKFEEIGNIIHDIQHGLFHEGRDLTDEQAYIHILKKYDIDEEEFFTVMKSHNTAVTIENEFELAKKLQINAYPSILLQVSIDKFYIIAQGYETFENVSQRITDILAEINN